MTPAESTNSFLDFLSLTPVEPPDKANVAGRKTITTDRYLRSVGARRFRGPMEDESQGIAILRGLYEHDNWTTFLCGIAHPYVKDAFDRLFSMGWIKHGHGGYIDVTHKGAEIYYRRRLDCLSYSPRTVWAMRKYVSCCDWCWFGRFPKTKKGWYKKYAVPGVSGYFRYSGTCTLLVATVPPKNRGIWCEEFVPEYAMPLEPEECEL